ncbi:MAG: hypothetical protein ACI30S_08635 [Muribaculaceae bacterium]
MKRITNQFLTLLIVAFLGLSFTSCGSDDDDVITFSDYYMECVDVNGGGLSEQECSMLKNSINSDLVLYYWKAVEKEKAIYYFDTEVNVFLRGMASGISGLIGELKITFALKDKQTGKIVKTTTVYITNTGSHL